MNMLTVVYAVTGGVLCGFAWLTLIDPQQPHRRSSALFWLILGLLFLLGDVLPHWVSGALVLAMVAVDGTGRVSRAEAPAPSEPPSAPSSLGNRIFLPVVAIPIVTFALAICYRVLGLDVNRGALVGLGIGGIVAMIVAMRVTRGAARELMEEGRRLNAAMGAVTILPQLLAALGVIFTAAKVGEMLASGIQRVVPADNLFLLCAASCIAMTGFTMLMGNSFAAFPVIVTGIVVPLIIRPFGVPPEMVAIITLTAGSSGTLITPMAANFNIIPTALLEMKDTYGVIRFQLPYAVAMWTFHVVLLWGMSRLLMTGAAP